MNFFVQSFRILHRLIPVSLRRAINRNPTFPHRVMGNLLATEANQLPFHGKEGRTVEEISKSVTGDRFFLSDRWIHRETFSFHERLLFPPEIFRNFMKASNPSNLSGFILDAVERNRPATFKSLVGLTACELPAWNCGEVAAGVLYPFPRICWQISSQCLYMKNISKWIVLPLRKSRKKEFNLRNVDDDAYL